MRLQLPTDRFLLTKLADGRNMAANLAAEIDRHSNYINQRLAHLADYGLVEKIGPAENTGLYELTPKGRAALAVIDQYAEVDDFDALVDEELARRSSEE